MKAEITDIVFKKSADGFPCVPLKNKKEIRVKVRPFRLDCTKREFGNKRGNLIEFEKINTTPNLSLYIDRDIYLTEEGMFKMKNITIKYWRQPITTDLFSVIEEEYLHLFKILFLHGDLFFEPPIIFDCVITFSFDGVIYDNNKIGKEPLSNPPVFKISGEYFFDYY